MKIACFLLYCFASLLRRIFFQAVYSSSARSILLSSKVVLIQVLALDSTNLADSERNPSTATSDERTEKQSKKLSYCISYSIIMSFRTRPNGSNYHSSTSDQILRRTPSIQEEELHGDQSDEDVGGGTNTCNESDIMTVSDIHTLTAADEAHFAANGMMIARTNTRDDEDMDLYSDVHTIQTLDGAFTLQSSQPSQNAATNGGSTLPSNGTNNKGPPGHGPFNGAVLEPIPASPPRLEDQKDSQAASKFWSRLSSNRNSSKKQDKDGPPLAALSTMPTKSSDEEMPQFPPHDNDDYDGLSDCPASLPGMIVIGTSNTNPTNSPTRSNHMSEADKSGTTTGAGTSTPSVWKQKLCGVRADRLIVLMMAILFLAVAVIVGAIIFSSQNNNDSGSGTDSSTRESETESGVTLTLTPKAAPTVAPAISMAPSDPPPTLAPTVSPAPTKAPTRTPTTAPTSTPTQEPTEVPTEAPTTEPTEAPVAAPTVAPVEMPVFNLDPTESPVANDLPCVDDPDGSFFAGPNQGVVDCAWLADLPEDRPLRISLCQPGAAAYQICQETCGTCEEPTVAAPTGVPVDAGAPTGVPVDAATVPPSANPAGSESSGSLEEFILAVWPGATLDDSGSDEGQAFDWLQPQYLAPGGVYEGASKERLVQVWALAVFAYATDFSGSWLSGGGGDECSWEGISCDGSGQVSAIELANSGLDGSLPSSLALLADSLDTLVVSENSLTGTLAPLTQLRNLEVLRIDRNNLSGIVPSNIDDWGSLRIWAFERNPQIGGEFPSSVENMVSLEELIFYYTGISGVMPSGVCDLPNLDVLTLDCRRVESECWTRCLYRCGGDTGVPCE